MARITVEDCLDNVDNRFELVMVASKRARQIATGGKEPLVPEENDKPTVLALREIELGLVTADLLKNEEKEVDDFSEIEEAVVRLEDLDRITGIWLLNSVRKWIDVHELVRHKGGRPCAMP